MTDDFAFQRFAGEQGRAFDAQCRLMLHPRFEVSERPFRVPEVGIEMDAWVTSRNTGLTYWCEFKGSWNGPRPGMMRTDTAKKALADVLLLYVAPYDFPPCIVLTSHMPVVGSSGHRMIATALEAGALFDIFCLSDPADMRRLWEL
jgi:hypothetical protein